MSLYHADLGLPDGFALPPRVVGLVWTEHAKSACNNDRYGVIPISAKIDLKNFSVIEVDITGRKVNKVVIRGELDEANDIIYVLIPGMEWTVKTVWLNRWNDTHTTLDKSKYVC